MAESTPPQGTPQNAGPAPLENLVVKFFVDGKEVGIPLQLMAKNFSTGSVGYFGSNKFQIGDGAEKGYQVQIQMIRIGSKPAK